MPIERYEVEFDPIEEQAYFRKYGAAERRDIFCESEWCPSDDVAALEERCERLEGTLRAIVELHREHGSVGDVALVIAGLARAALAEGAPDER